MRKKNVVLDTKMMALICRDLREESMTILEMEAKYLVAINSLRRFIHLLHDARFAYIAEYRRTTKLWQPAYSFGRGRDDEYPGKSKPISRLQVHTAKYQMVLVDKFIELLKALKDGPKSIADLESYCHMSPSTIGELMPYGHSIKFFRIAAWEREDGKEKGVWARQWGIGSFRDAKRPPAQTKQEDNAKNNARIKARKQLLQRGPMSIFNPAVL